MPDHRQVKSFYDEQYYGLTHVGDAAALPWHMHRVAGRLGLDEGQAALDIACGAGSWLTELARRGAKVSGIDISERAVARACQRLPHADVRVGVAEQLPFSDAKFDLVTCMGSLEHFLDQPAALGEMLRVAKMDAHFLILVPNAGFLTRRLGLYGGTGQVAIRETVRPISEWIDMFHAAGLQVIAKWRDLHPLSWDWICRGAIWWWPIRALQAAALVAWPVDWQYQVYFWCMRRDVA